MTTCSTCKYWKTSKENPTLNNPCSILSNNFTIYGNRNKIKKYPYIETDDIQAIEAIVTPPHFYCNNYEQLLNGEPYT